MPVIALNQAVRDIRRSCDLADPPEASPFFFMVGAGISSPAVPLASGIIEECQKQVQGVVEPSNLTHLERYSFWFQQAFPSPEDRKKYLRGKIQGEGVTRANLRLAHLMISKKIANLTVTVNFDDFLLRSLLAFGAYPIVCDHPETILKVDLQDRNQPQVVHLHGSYQFYNCRNIVGEVVSGALRPNSSPFSMADFLSSLLTQRSPLVVGYSGWAADVFMSAMLRRLKRPLQHNIYWFCFAESEWHGLPSELIEHPNVFLVCPPSDVSGPSDDRLLGL